MSKEQKSKLDPFAASIDEWFGEQKLTIKEVVAKLAEDGVSISQSQLSVWWRERQGKRMEAELLGRIASGARQCKEVEAQFAKNAAPELETIIKLNRVMVMQLATQGRADPKMLMLADQLTRTAMEFVSGQTKAKIESEKLTLARAKFEMEFCEKLLDAALRAKADEINASNLSNADKIAALRKEYFKDVDELQQSGKVVLPE